MRQHIKSNNIILLINLLEFKQDIALMAINNQQLMRAYSAIFYMRIKMLQLGNTKLIYYLAVITYCYNLVQQYIITLVLYREVVLTYKDQKQRDSLSIGVNSLNYYYLFAVSQLNYFQMVTLLRAYYNYASSNNAYLEASFIKVI